MSKQNGPRWGCGCLLLFIFWLVGGFGLVVRLVDAVVRLVLQIGTLGLALIAIVFIGVAAIGACLGMCVGILSFASTFMEAHDELKKRPQRNSEPHLSA